MEALHIRIKFPCNIYPFIPHFCKVYFSYLFIQNVNCGNSLEPPPLGNSNVYPQSMFEQKYHFFRVEFSFFATENNLCILHG